MDVQERVELYINKYPENLMTTEKFWNNLVNEYNALRSYLKQCEVETADAEDALQDLAAWGGAKDWDKWNRDQLTNAFEKNKELNTTFGFRDMKLTLGWQWRDKHERTLMYKNEIPVESGNRDEDIQEELDGMLKYEAELEEITESIEALAETHQSDALKLASEDVESTLRPTEVYLDNLTPKQREAIILRNDGWGQEEIGELMGIKQHTACELIQRGLYTWFSRFSEIARLYAVYTLLSKSAAAKKCQTADADEAYERYAQLMAGKPVAYTEVGFDCGPQHDNYRKWDASLSSDNYKLEKGELEALIKRGESPLIYRNDLCTYYQSRPAPVAIDEKPRDFYWSSATRLFNCLGLGRQISDATLGLIKQLA